MARAEGIILALTAPQETGQASRLPDCMQAVPAPGEYFMRVGLVTYIPDYTVMRRVKHVVQSRSQFYGAQARSEVPPDFGHGVDQEPARFIAHLLQLVLLTSAQVSRRVERHQQRIFLFGIGHVISLRLQCSRLITSAARSSKGSLSLIADTLAMAC